MVVSVKDRVVSKEVLGFAVNQEVFAGKLMDFANKVVGISVKESALAAKRMAFSMKVQVISASVDA